MSPIRALVNHLLIEFADAVRVAALALRPGQEHPEQAAVGNGAAAGHRDAAARLAGAAKVPVVRSQISRGRSSANSSLG